jgi:hypothetical protein
LPSMASAALAGERQRPHAYLLPSCLLVPVCHICCIALTIQCSFHYRPQHLIKGSSSQYPCFHLDVAAQPTPTLLPQLQRHSSKTTPAQLCHLFMFPSFCSCCTLFLPASLTHVVFATALQELPALPGDPH